MKTTTATRRSWLLNAALLATVVGLGAFIYFKPVSDAPASYSLSKLQAGEVKHIRVERKGDAPIVIERKGDSWHITAPLSAQADPFQVQRLLAILDASAAHRFAATDLARFDLDRPQARLTIDGQHFSFGTVSAVTRQQYVLAAGTVYAIEPRYGGMLPQNAEQLIKKQLFAANEAPVRFEFRDFTVVMSDGRWQVSPPSGELSQDDVQRWVDAWRHAAALRAAPDADRTPLSEIRMEFKDGRKLTLGILQREPEFVIARPDENLRYHFPAETARRLLAPPGSNR